MVRFNATQSVWKNSEDEILKAAVMKYGLNQWGRVASLFAKRSARQCKARWFEWLDPTIKKTEWSREEDERLLHLAKLMPTQWKTIAPLVGRTAAQCLERYERLLDAVSGDVQEDDEEEEEAQGEGEEGAASSSSAGLKKKRVAIAETLPAKPDAIDMDEEELEMLSEAKARLANTLGKKAKRKARERQLEEQKRIAELQKRRELKAAGISTGKAAEIRSNKRRRKNSDAEAIDYTQEVPFEQLAPKGPYDVSKEKLETARRERDERARIEKLAQAQEIKKKKPKAKKTPTSVKDLEAKLATERRKNEEALAIARSARPSLLLPAPQISDAELEDVAKASLPAPSFGKSSAPFAPPAMPSRRRDEVIAQEAKNQLARDGVGSIAGEGTGFSGANPSANASEPRRGLASLASRRTFAGANGRVVVLRDELGINRSAAFIEEEGLEDAEHLAQGQSATLATSLSAIPAPEYEYSVQVKKPSKESTEDFEEQPARPEDARDRERKKQRLTVERNEAVQNSLPTAAKLGLPEIPYITSWNASEEKDEARRMILEEMQRGLATDTTHSVPTSTCREVEEIVLAKADLEDISMDALFAPSSSSPSTSFANPKDLFSLARSQAAKVAKETEGVRKVAESSMQAELARAEALAKKLMELHRETKHARKEVQLYSWMKNIEDQVVLQRTGQLASEVEMLAQRERELQTKWVEKAM